MTIKRKFSILALLLCLGWGMNSLSAQTTYEFTTGGATGNTGPTQGMMNTAYTGTPLDGDVTVVGGIQYWVVPTTATYLIEAFGGQGYGNFGGRGAHISGEFLLSGGDTLKILVGQMAGHYLNYPSTTYNHQFGGGGGSFVTTMNNTPLIVAGGGGGNHGTSYVASCDGQAGNNGAAGANASLTGAGGTGGMGGQQASSADAGGGLLGNGNGTAGGQSFINGGLGGIDEGTGGFGCGGGTSSWNNYRGGGGGGYSGGGGGNNSGSCCPCGGGGGSFNAGTNPVNNAGVQIGDGLVRIIPLTRYPNNAGLERISGFQPPVCAGIYPVEAIVKNFGSNQLTQVTLEWSVNGVMQPDTTVMAMIDTLNGAGPDTLPVTIGNVPIFSQTTIKVWTSMPNGVADTINFEDTLEITIAEPAIANGMVDMDVSCFDGTDGMISAMGTGGTPGYTYSWSTGDTSNMVSNLSIGDYIVTITDNDGCSHSDTVTVGQPTAVSSVLSVDDISCNGETDGQIVVNPTGGTPGYVVMWMPGGNTTFLDSLAAGTYNYTVTDANGCTFMDSVTISEPAALSASGAVTDETLPGNGAIDLTVSGGTAGYTYSWSNGETTEDISGLTGGVYTVVVTDANGCTEILTFTVNSTVVAIDDVQNGISYEVFPNPNNGSFRVQVADATEPITIQVVDMLGKVIQRVENANAVTEFNLNEENGIYLLNITVGERSATQRVMIAK